MPRAQGRVQAPAKLNLTLRVVGLRADGYHLIDSLMVPISLYDDIRLALVESTTAAPQVRLRSTSPDAPGDHSNLAYRAAVKFLEMLGYAETVEIELTKRIPVGSGLGGGSSDAAAVLLGLNNLLGAPFDSAALMRLGLTIGADVPFFVHGTPARVCGVGEIVEPVRLPGPIHAVVCCDGFQLSTARVYSRVSDSLTNQRPDSRIRDFVAGRARLRDVLVNDLEAAAGEIHPPILSLKAQLLEFGAAAALMTGSGSALFGVWPDARSTATVARQLRAEGWWAEAVEVLTAPPILAGE